MRRHRSALFIPIALFSLLLVACGDDSPPGGTAGGTEVAPKEFYSGDASSLLGADGNEAKCSTCHSDDGTQQGFSGSTFQDIAYHATFKGGEADLLGGVNACVTGWMGGAALAEADEGFLKLKEYMESISSPDATQPNAIAPEVLDDEAAYEAAYAGGDAAAGAAKYATSCGRCHDGALTVGSTPAPSLVALASYTVGRIAQQVRTSGPPPSGAMDASDTTPGPMPFFEAKDLAVQDLADIIAHIKAM